MVIYSARRMASRFDRFLAELSSVVVSERACNQYSRIEGDLAGNAIRRRNLRLYLTQLDAIGPRILLIGEAPSYRGGRLSGVAFVSESLMLGGVGPYLGAANGFRKATPGPRLATEASATMVWETIGAIEPLPILWNAFPFHPFHAGNPATNRPRPSSRSASRSSSGCCGCSRSGRSSRSATRRRSR